MVLMALPVNLGLGGGVDPQMIYTVLEIVMWTLIFVIVGLILTWFVFRPLTYKVKVIILDRRADGKYQIDHDRGKFITKRNSQQEFKLYKASGLFGNKLSLEPPSYSDLGIASNGKPVLALEKWGERDYRPLHITDVFAENPFEPTDIEVRNWMVLQLKQSVDKFTKPGFLEKYGGVITLILLFVFALVILNMTLSKVGEISMALTGASDRMAIAVEEFGKQIVAAK